MKKWVVPYTLLLLFLCIGAKDMQGQIDTLRLKRLIEEVNETFLYPFTPAILLSPFELKEFNRARSLKHIELVDGVEFYRIWSSKTDTLSIRVENNRTVVQNSRTYFYHKDGRIDKVLRGRSLNDQYVYDHKGYLIQHGKGGELKKANRQGNVFSWTNVKRDRLEYVVTYGEQDRVVSFKTQGHHFGPAVDYEQEDYLWEENRLVGKNTLLKYKEGGVDSTFLKFEYDELGLLKAMRSRDEGESRWSGTELGSKIELLGDDSIRIALLANEQIQFAMTFDAYDNWISMERPNQTTLRREFRYRKKRRRK